MKQIRKAIARRLFPNREQFAAPAGAASRQAAWFDFLVVDFGILRLFWKNRAQFSARAWRMNQPYPADIAWAKRRGIRTIVTARHDARHGGHALISEACARQGLAYSSLPLLSRDAPSAEALLEAAAFFAAVEKPILIHCKSGADRAGFLAALYLITVDKVPVRQAMRQLSLRYLHIRAARTGILDAVFEAYLKAHPDEAVPFLDWVRETYDPIKLTESFHAGRFADFIDRIVLRHE